MLSMLARISLTYFIGSKSHDQTKSSCQVNNTDINKNANSWSNFVKKLIDSVEINLRTVEVNK